MSGDTDAGRTDLTVTTTFSDLKTDQDIAVPAAEQVQAEEDTCRISATGDGGVVESAGCRVLVQTVDDFRADSPDHPCLELEGSTPADRQTFLRCLDDNGEADVAQAIRTYVQAFPPGLR